LEHSENRDSKGYALSLGATDCSLSKCSLDFNLQGPCPVRDFEEKRYELDEVTIFNNSKSKKTYFQVQCFPNPKFELIINPLVGEIKKVR
jgi:hypothetical protein